MCKKRNPGCTCCCGPVEQRSDDFSSAWKCYKGTSSGTSYAALNTDWQIDTATGQLIRYDTGSSGAAIDQISVDAVRFQIPFSMEIYLEVDEYLASQLWLNMNQILSNQTFLATARLNPFSDGGTKWYMTCEMTDGSGSSKVSYVYIDAISAPYTLKYRWQVDTDGMTHWLWINGSIPTTLASEPGTGAPGWNFGTKWTKSFTGLTLTANRVSWWSIRPQRVFTTPPTSPIGKFNKWDVRIWDHIANP